VSAKEHVIRRDPAAQRCKQSVLALPSRKKQSEEASLARVAVGRSQKKVFVAILELNRYFGRFRETN